MIKTLTVKNFRQFKERSFSFEPGLNAIIGANEAGKTTLLMAVAYAWFGANALDEAVANVVTWDMPLSSLKVELAQEFDGVVYTVKRSPTGAECRYGDVTVTGQAEVTRLFERLLGTSGGVAGRLFLAGQTELQGVAAGGAGKAAALIERLSNLDLVDAVIETVRRDNPSSGADEIQLSIAAYSQEADSIDVSPPDLGTHEASLKATEHKVTTLAAAMGLLSAEQAASRKAISTLTAELGQATAERASRGSLQESLLLRSAQLGKLFDERKALPTYPAEQVATLLERRKAENDRQVRKGLHEKVQTFNAGVQALTVPVMPEGLDLGTFYFNVKEARRISLAEQKKLDTMASQLTGQLITATACGLCGKDLTDVPEVQTKNAELRERIEELRLRAKAQEAMHTSAQKDIEACEAFDSAYTRLTIACPAVALQPYCQTVERPHGLVLYSWMDARSLEPDTALQADEAAYARHQGTLAQLDQAISREQAVIKSAENVLAQPTLHRETQAIELELAAANSNLSESTSGLAATTQAHGQARTDSAVLSGQIRELRADHQRRVERKASLITSIAGLETRLASVATAAELLSILMKAKPVLTEQIWNTVMSAISTYFSRIRGTPSVVVRQEGRFIINGRPVTSYSGSTKDSLGLAIRIALTQMFVPNTRIMALDEPGAACDDNREAAMLGVIASAGFKQVLLVTHSTVANSLADNVIEV